MSSRRYKPALKTFGKPVSDMTVGEYQVFLADLRASQVLAKLSADDVETLMAGIYARPCLAEVKRQLMVTTRCIRRSLATLCAASQRYDQIVASLRDNVTVSGS